MQGLTQEMVIGRSDARDSPRGSEAIVDTFRKKVRDIPGWEVTDDVAITNLSFTKYLMWKDLADRADALRASEMAKRLMDGRPQDGEPPAVPTPFDGDKNHIGALLDDIPSLAELACPMEADSSQLQAVAAAARGESYVLIGPPGTGKRQTITNIIANTLAQGKSVLFVAEKRAALEVVQRRLKQVALGDFCLDLFSAKASKSAVLEQLNQAQMSSEIFNEAEWSTTTQQVAELRAELNGYVRELHRRARNGWTAYKAIGVILRAETAGIPVITLSWPSSDQHDAGDYKKLVLAVEDAAASLSSLGDVRTGTALIGIDRTEWAPTWEASNVGASRVASQALARVHDALPGAIKALGLPAACQSARKRDPVSACKRDPLAMHASAPGLAGAEP